jgi:hypothetical protein
VSSKWLPRNDDLTLIIKLLMEQRAKKLHRLGAILR